MVREVYYSDASDDEKEKLYQILKLTYDEDKVSKQKKLIDDYEYGEQQYKKHIWEKGEADYKKYLWEQGEEAYKKLL
jgi:hypothetical protein